jgi:hypothetical protein
MPDCPSPSPNFPQEIARAFLFQPAFLHPLAR